MQVITKGEIGGAQTHVLSLCQGLVKRIAIIAVIGGPTSASTLGDELRELGVPVYSLPELGNSLSPLQVLAAVRALLRLIKLQKPDVLHAHSSVAGVVARIAGRLAGTPVIYTVHGFGFKPEAPRLQRWAAFVAEWLLAGITDHMICVSDYEKGLAGRLPIAPGRLSVVRNAVPDTLERARPGRDPVRIIMVARFAQPKRQDILLRALALVHAALGHEIPASLVGSGPELEARRALAHRLDLKSIDFTGDVEDVSKRLAQHHVFVLMSDHEGLPISIIEAMRAGLAIVASDLPGVRELLTHQKEGLVVRNDPQALADILVTLAADAEGRASLGSEARRRYEARFTPEPMATAVEGLYGQIASHAVARHPSH